MRVMIYWKIRLDIYSVYNIVPLEDEHLPINLFEYRLDLQNSWFLNHRIKFKEIL